MTRARLLTIALASALLLSGCDSGAGDDHAALPDEPTDRAEQPQSPAAPGQDESTPVVPPLHPSVDDYPEALVALAQGEVTLAVKLADTPERRQHGLMEVEDLPAGTGMLFVFEDARTGGFWMKDTLVPLDIAYADADGVIVSIQAMQPCTADPCDVYDPGAPYQRALEVPRGWFAQVGIEVGDTLEWEPLDG